MWPFLVLLETEKDKDYLNHELDVAKFLISTKVQEVIDYAVKININGNSYEIKICVENLEDCSSCLLSRKRDHYSNLLTNDSDEIASSSLQKRMKILKIWGLKTCRI
ncbi:hypothetical protein VNO78_17396 [Psophocarpus tetragonolobus]|uniref:Uncharacterized protein n=1 Tax=Psophocarpus tetragonolobus TaxID=3891 RepID=A0AAN9SHA4_PSOTE